MAYGFTNALVGFLISKCGLSVPSVSLLLLAIAYVLTFAFMCFFMKFDQKSDHDRPLNVMEALNFMTYSVVLIGPSIFCFFVSIHLDSQPEDFPASGINQTLFESNNQ